MSNSKKILYSLASRSRPEKLINCIENIINLSRHDNYIILLTLDVDDVTVATKEFNEKLKSYGEKVKPVYQFSKSKIDAINKNTWIITDFDILINFSDDQKFLIEGFDLEIIKDMEEFFPDTDGFLHYPDSHAKHLLPTMSIIGKKYYARFNYIYHPDYVNVYCDNEAMDVAKILGKHQFVDKNIYDHFHPAWGTADTDEQYLKSENPASYAIDAATYEKRKLNNFGL